MEQQQPVVYITQVFFLSFIEEIESITIHTPIEKRKKLLLLEELLIYKSTLYIDLNDNDFDHYMQPDFQPKNDKEKIFYPYFKILVNQNKIGKCSSSIEYFRQKKYQHFDQLETKPNYVFLSETSDFCEKVGQEFGVICFSKQLNYSCNVFEIIKKTAKLNQPINVNRGSDFISHLPFSHTIKLTDPYLLRQDHQFIIELIKCLVATKVKITLKICLNNSSGLNIKVLEEDIYKNVKNLEPNQLLIEDRRFIHNRNIITNTFCLFSDYGFMKKYTKDEANWITYPLNKEFKLVK